MLRKYNHHFFDSVGNHTICCYSEDQKSSDHVLISFGDSMSNRIMIEAKFLNQWISVLKALRSKLIAISELPAQL